MNVEHGGAKTRVLTRDAGLLLIFPETFVFYFNKKKTIIDNRASVSITGTKIIIKIGFLETKR